MSLAFRYQARNLSGRIERGTLNAQSRAEALERLRRRSLTPFDIAPARDGSAGQRLNDIAARDLARTLSRLLRAGLPFAQALKFAGEELPAASAAAAAKMQEAAARGERASAALQDYGGGQAQLLAGVIAAGESSGRLAEALDVAAAAFTRSAELKARLGGALIYPGFVIAATCATLASFLIFVVPTLGQAFEGSEAKLPASTLSILHLSAWLRGEGGLDILAGLACVVLALITPAVRARLGVVAAHAALSPLGMGVAERLAFSAFASLAALSLQAGVPVPQAFEAGARAQTNPVTRRRLSAVAAAIRSGEAPSVALERNGGAPRAFVRLARLGEETGSLGETLKEAGVLLSAEAEQRLERLSAIAGPVVTLALGGLVASVVMSLFLGLLSLSDMALA